MVPGESSADQLIWGRAGSSTLGQHSIYITLSTVRVTRLSGTLKGFQLP